MKQLLTLFILFSTFSFGQYIKKATFVLSDGKTMDVEDLIISNNIYEFRSTDNKLNLQTLNQNEIKDIKFDSINYLTEIPERKETLSTHNKPNGLYETIDDFYNGTPTSVKEIIGRADGERYYNYPKDLMLFKDSNKRVVSSPFAIVYENDIYFNVKGLNKIESKEMKALYSNSDAINRYIRVKYNNENYYYTEVYQRKVDNSQVIGAMLFGIIGAIATSGINPKEIDVFPIILLNQDRRVYQVNDCVKFNKVLKDKLNYRIQCRKPEDNNLLNVRKSLIK